MTDEARQDERMIEWLADGPWDPPSEVLEAAVAHARSHPRRAHRIGGLRRSLMSGIHLTPVHQRPAGHRTAFAVLAAAAAIVIVATVGIVGGMNLNNVPVIPVGTDGTSEPSAGPSVSPVEIDAVLSGCRFTSRGGEQVVGDLTQVRGRAYACDLTSPDPRLDGTAAFTYNYDNLADGDEPWGSADTWGTLSIQTTDGSWDGMWRGDVHPFGFSLRHRMWGALVGAGAYDGLRVRWTLQGGGTPQGPGLAFSPDSRWTFSAVLETVDSIARPRAALLSGTAFFISWSTACQDVEPGTQEIVDGVTQVRGAVVECSGSISSDPRLDGVARSTLNADRQADESAHLWGTEEIRVGGELRWRGEYSGTVAVGYTTHHLEGVDIGYGPYAGLEYHWTTIGDPETGYVTSGRIVSASSD